MGIAIDCNGGDLCGVGLGRIKKTGRSRFLYMRNKVQG